AQEVLPALRAESSAACFLFEWKRTLQVYGGRSDLWDWGYPSWQDDPTPVLNNLKNYLAQPDRDLLAERAQAAAEREEAIATARAALENYPQPVVERFEQLLAAAQVALVLTENHTFYIDFNGFGWIHRLIREFGRRFSAQGRLSHPDDIFYLSLEDLRQLMTQPGLSLKQRALESRAEIEKWRQYEEPLELGTRPASPLALYSADSRRVARYSGSTIAGEDESDPLSNQLRGQAGSPGKVQGRARVLTSLSQAHLLQPGEILVTPTTAPPWTPLFLTAAAVVTDAGGLLSHGAVVAREYRIPAVVGTHCASRVIQTGQWIEVDGSQGLVTLL
ncbi:MAG TPA: PEP-utilizing enzyme, partial [Anaerolineaceae bacterium]|nr:PEP-utilizing enzyme [Anaerolineaceae bacterium]